MSESLIERAQAGDERAFRELFVTHRETVARIVQRVMGPSPELEDIVQDVFLHVHRSLGSFRGESKFTTWLYRLTVNVTRMHLRRGRSRPRFADVPVPEGPTMERPASLGPDEVTEQRARIAALYRLLDGLSEKKRAVLVLHDFEGMAAKDIAEIVEAPVLTVRTRLFYARKELYAAIAEDPKLGPVAETLLGDLPGRPASSSPAGTPSGDASSAAASSGGSSPAPASSAEAEAPRSTTPRAGDPPARKSRP
jgi:RNA polymerase sigma-70 factor (ECF subfamily)